MIDEPFAEPYMTAEEQDELAPLARLESQNQALQEELRKYQPGQGEGWPDDRHEFAARLTTLREVAEALQERAEKAEALLRRIWEEGLYEDQTSELIETFFGPTQETDPE